MALLEAATLCLAMNLYHEARSEGPEGMMAVAEVTMNRVQDERFPNTVCGVVHQGRKDNNGNMIPNQCQFSWYCDGKGDNMNEGYSKDLAMMIASFYVSGVADTDLTHGATHYHAALVYPYWAKEYPLTAIVGTHIFYTWE